MKSILLVALLLPSVLLAQVAQPSPGRRLIQPPNQAPAEALPDNYQLTLNVTDKDGQPLEVSLVVASTHFNATLGDQNLSFSGSLTIEESGGLLVAYSLGWETPVPAGGNIQFRSSSTQGSVRLKPGEEVQIIRAGPRTVRLSVKKLEAPKAK